MPKPATIEPATEFAYWLTDAMRERGWERKTLALNSGVGQSSVSQLIGGLRSPSREMVERLALSLSPEDADEHTARALLNGGLRAAGFAPTEDAGDPLDTIVHEAGYNADALDEDARRQLRQSVDAVVIGIMEQERRKRQ